MKSEKKRTPHPPGSNNLVGGPTLEQQARRNQIEDVMAACMSASDELAEVAVRIEYALRCASAVTPVLLPALERVQSVRVQIERLHTDLSQYWQAGQLRRWT